LTSLLLGHLIYTLEQGFESGDGVIEAKCEEIDLLHPRKISILVLRTKRA
jgi:hypothetical protein